MGKKDSLGVGLIQPFLFARSAQGDSVFRGESLDFRAG